MRPSTSLHILITLLSVLTPALTRQTPTSYCKCTCFGNNTIIPLNSPPQQPKPPSSDPPTISTPPQPPQQPSDGEQQPTTPENPDQSTSNAAARRASIPNLPRDALNPYNILAGDSIFRRDDDSSNNGNGNGEGDSGRKHHRTLTCSDCNRAFCLDYNLPICKGAKEKDIFTTCFQRDSVKDETVVLLFVLLTASLLSWAILKPYVDRFRNAGSLAAYSPVALSGDYNGGNGGGNGAGGVGAARRGAGARAGAGAGVGNILPRTEHPYRDGDSDIDRRRNVRDQDDAGSIARQGGLNS